MKNCDLAKKFTSSTIKNFLKRAEKKRKRRAEAEKTASAPETKETAPALSSKSSSHHSKNRHEKKNPRPLSRHEKENPRSLSRYDKKYSPISFSAAYAKVSSISYSSIKTTFSPSQFYQQQSPDPATASATGAPAATNSAPPPNPQTPPQFQQPAAYNPFSPQSIGPAAPQQWQQMSTGPTYPSTGPTYPAYTRAFYTYSRPSSPPPAVTVPSPSGYAKEIENMKKLYKKNMKYSKNNDNFNHKLNIFHHFCDKSDIPYEARSKAFSSMFRGFAFDYYLANVNMLKHASLDQLCTFICTHFEKSINVKNNFIK